ncbi:MAG: hypothetical protein JXB50_08220 [Spirochaetes bacterium]|nr:hypothetical protein [Spirochaetota bacterium]
MSKDKFGEFLIKKTNGKVTGKHVYEALMIQRFIRTKQRKLGEILVDNLILSKKELMELLKIYEEYKNFSN